MKKNSSYVIACSAILLLSSCVGNHNPETTMSNNFTKPIINNLQQLPWNNQQSPSDSSNVQQTAAESDTSQKSPTQSNNSQTSPSESTNTVKKAEDKSNSSNPTPPADKATGSVQTASTPQSQDPAKQKMQDEINSFKTKVLNKAVIFGTIDVGASKIYHISMTFNGYSESNRSFVGTLESKEDKVTNQFGGNFGDLTLNINELVNLPNQDTSYTRQIILNPVGNGQFESGWIYDDLYQDNIKVTIGLNN